MMYNVHVPVKSNWIDDIDNGVWDSELNFDIGINIVILSAIFYTDSKCPGCQF